jgi:hypothetical protein
MLFMVIERFKDRDPIPVYKRVRDQGIKFPEGLTSRELDRAELRPLLPADGMRRRAAAPGMGAELSGARHDLRVVPVVPSKETREVVAPFLDSK